MATLLKSPKTPRMRRPPNQEVRKEEHEIISNRDHAIKLIKQFDYTRIERKI